MHAPVPEQLPDQPAKVDPLVGVAVSVTDVPEVKLAVQEKPQLIPLGLLVTVPLPVPDFETLTLNVTNVNVAVTERA